MVIGGMERIDLRGSDTAADRLTGGRARDTFWGGGGDDTLVGGAGADSLVGGPGNDLLEGDAGDDVLTDRAGQDTLLGGSGNDDLGIELGNACVIDGGDGDNDTLSISFRDVQSSSGIRLDLAAATDANGVLKLDDGSAIRGVENYWIDGSRSSSNQLVGGPGNDVLKGGDAGDVISGGPGDDLIGGEYANDTLSGGPGADRFFFHSSSSTVITDYDPGTDTLGLYYRTFNALRPMPGRTLSPDAFRAGPDVTSAMDANDHILYNTTTGALYYDRDGTGRAAAVQIAELTGHPDLSAADISVAWWWI
jgi:Ca2+-binding RTX toxin-like protein